MYIAAKQQLKFEGVKGYATYDRATKRGEEVSLSLDMGPAQNTIRWMVVALPNGRFAPAFYCGNVPGGPGQFLSLTNVCCFN